VTLFNGEFLSLFLNPQAAAHPLWTGRQVCDLLNSQTEGRPIPELPNLWYALRHLSARLVSF